MATFDLILPVLPGKPPELVLDPTVPDLCVNGDQWGLCRAQGCDVEGDGVTIEQTHLNAAIEQIARQLGQDINEQHPFLDTRFRTVREWPPCIRPAALAARR